jgi:hypothetical protein
MGMRVTVATARTLPRVGADMDRQKPAPTIQLLFMSREMTGMGAKHCGGGCGGKGLKTTENKILFVLRFYNVKKTH